MLLFWSRSTHWNEHNLPSPLTDGTPHSSSNLLSSSLVLFVTLFPDDFSQSKFSSILIPWTNSSKSNSPFSSFLSRTSREVVLENFRRVEVNLRLIFVLITLQVRSLRKPLCADHSIPSTVSNSCIFW